jgi:hypothetical protein
MDLAEFDRLAESLRHRSALATATDGLPLIEGFTSTAQEITDVEQHLGVTLPDKYKSFMMRYGGGGFGFVELIPLTSPPSAGIQDLDSLNREEFPDRSFIAVAPVGTGDYWGFPVTHGRCHDQVWFHFHDADDPELDADDFLEFVARHGLQP